MSRKKSKKEQDFVKTRVGKVRKFFNEFKTFAVKGNMLDMAVGIIVGGAFTVLVNSIVNNLATPLLGVLIGIDFSAWEVQLPHLYGDGGSNVLQIGVFLNAVISFIVVAFTVFLFVKAINSFRKRAEAANAPETPPLPPEPTKEELLLTEIRDLLKDKTNHQRRQLK